MMIQVVCTIPAKVSIKEVMLVKPPLAMMIFLVKNHIQMGIFQAKGHKVIFKFAKNSALPWLTIWLI